MHEIERKKKELVRKWKSRKPCKAMARNQKGAKTYLIQNGTSSLYKIGQSVDVGKRFNEIKSHNPDAKLLHVSKTLHERDLHERYKTKRKFREWFELSPGDVYEITASE